MPLQTAEQREKMDKKKNSYFKGIGFGILMVILFYVIQFAVMFAMIFAKLIPVIANAGGDTQAVMNSYMKSVQEPEFLTLATAVATAATALVFGLWYKLRYAKKSMGSYFQNLKQNIMTKKNFLVFLMSGICCYWFMVVISLTVSVLFPSAWDMYGDMMGAATGGNPFFTFVFVVLLAPIGEECFFRGILQRKFMNWMPVVPAIILQTVFFGIFHMNLVQGIGVLGLGIVAGYVSYRCNSVLPAIFLHFVNNGFSMLITYLPDSVKENSIVLLLIAIVSFALLFVVIKFVPGKLMEVQDGRQPLPETEQGQELPERA